MAMRLDMVSLLCLMLAALAPAPAFAATCKEPAVEKVCECNHYSHTQKGYQCSECKDKFKWGFGCDLECKKGCEFGCDLSGNCLVPSGRHCKKNSRQEDQLVTADPTLNLHGECQACEHSESVSWWGVYCDQKCPNHCGDTAEGASCTRGGLCYRCKKGFWGSKCENDCPKACPDCVMKDNYELLNPNVPNEYRPAGSCKNGCAEGSDKWGDSCEHACPKNCKKSQLPSCLKENGNCFKCEGHAWYGDKCENQCSQGCNQNACNKDTAVCEYGCKVGWWKPTCDEKCGGGCRGNACNVKTGKCSQGCKPGKWGEYCDEDCPDGTVVDEKDGCDQETGLPAECEEGTYPAWEMTKEGKMPLCKACPDKCKDGKCTDKGECSGGCVLGFHGPRCEKNCPPHCIGPCDKPTTGLSLDGACKQCVDGWTGKMCTKQCHDTCTSCAQIGDATGPDKCLSCPKDEPVHLKGGRCECIEGAERGPDGKCHCKEPKEEDKRAFFETTPVKLCRGICKRGLTEIVSEEAKESICLTNQVHKAVVKTGEYPKDFKQGRCTKSDELDIVISGDAYKCLRKDFVENIMWG